MKVISYASQTNYHLHSGKLEFLALMWSITEKLRENYYVNKFTVHPDNNSLPYEMTTAKLNATGMNVSQLADFNFKVKYRPGKSSQDCDYLSRNPVEDKLSSCTDKTDSDNFKIFVNSV